MIDETTSTEGGKRSGSSILTGVLLRLKFKWAQS